MKLGKATGALSGVAHGAGTYRITVRVTDRLSASATKALELVVG